MIGGSGADGVGSDPYKIAATRAIGRARSRYLREAASPLLDDRYRNFSRFFTKNAVRPRSLATTPSSRTTDWEIG